MHNQIDEIIQSQVSLRSNREHIIDSIQMLIFTCLLILVILTIWFFKQKRISYIHETGLALFYGNKIFLNSNESK
jgi:sodium/hydrogen exchanger-like protein 6/7